MTVNVGHAGALQPRRDAVWSQCDLASSAGARLGFELPSYTFEEIILTLKDGQQSFILGPRLLPSALGLGQVFLPPMFNGQLLDFDRREAAFLNRSHFRRMSLAFQFHFHELFHQRVGFNDKLRLIHDVVSQERSTGR